MKLFNAIFCDDIRFEINNKISLMGLYSDRIIFHVSNMAEMKWPLPIKLSVLLRFILEQDETYPDKFEFEYFLKNKSILKINGELSKEEKNQNYITLALAAGEIPLEPGPLGFSVKLYDEDKLLFSEDNMNAIKITAG